MLIHQAIYGDKSGSYALLNTSLADIELARRLCNITDLLDRPSNGLLPNSFIRGFAFNNFYIFIKSFPDNDPNVRSGRILSHTLIVEQKDLHQLNKLDKLFSHFLSHPDKNPDLRPIELYDNGSEPIQLLNVISREAAAVNGLLEHSNYSNTLVWVGEKGYCSFISQIWSQIEASLKVKLRLGICFNPQRIVTENINILYVLEEYENKWKNSDFYIVDKNDSGKLESMSSLLLAGYKDKSKPLSDFIKTFEMVLNDVEDFSYLEKMLPAYNNLSADTDFNQLIVLCDLISQFSPDSNVARADKKKLLEQVISRIELASPKQILTLKNTEWKGFFNAQQLISNQLAEWVEKSLFSSKVDNQVASVVTQVFDPENKALWWKKAFLDSFKSVLKTWKPTYAPVIWCWFTENHILVKSLKDFIPNTIQVETDFVKYWPKLKPKKELAQNLMELSKDRKWLSLYGLSLLRLYSTEESIKKQLKIDSDSEHYKALQGMSKLIKVNEFIQLAIKIGEDRLVKIAGEILADKPSCLNSLDMGNINGQRIWLEVISINNDPWSGINSPEKILDKLLNLLLAGKAVEDKLLIALAQTKISSIRNYSNRKEIWQYLPEIVKNSFIESTVNDILEEAEKDFDCLLELELELVSNIELKISKENLLDGDNISSELKIELLTIFNVDEVVCSSLIQNNAEILSFEQADKLGKLISEKKWKVSAKTIKRLKRKQKYLEPAWSQCEHLAPDAFFDPFWFLSPPSNTKQIENMGKYKILLLAASPTDQKHLNLMKEIREIKKLIRSSKYRKLLSFETEVATTFDTFTQAILDVNPDIIHFSGHGNINGIALEYDDGKTHFVDERTIDKIFSLLKDEVKCVLLNSCYSEKQAKAISKHGIYVVGMNDSIDDDAAIAFSSGFYQSIGAGKGYEYSFHWALTHVMAKATNFDQYNIPKLWIDGKIVR